jgi:hypothetical protein
MPKHTPFSPFQDRRRNRAPRPTTPPIPPPPPMIPSPPRSPSPFDEFPFEFEPQEPDDPEYEATLHDQYERQLRGVRGRRPIAVVVLSATQQLWVVPELGEFPKSFVVVAAVPYHGRLCVACNKCHCFEGSTEIADHIFQYATGDNLLLTQLDQATVNQWLDENACPHGTALTKVPSMLLPLFAIPKRRNTISPPEENDQLSLCVCSGILRMSS